MNTLLLLLLSTMSLAAPSISFGDINECEGRPDFITEVRSEILGGFEKLPPLLLVASDAEYYVESKHGQHSIRMHSYQSFKDSGSASAKIVCGNSKESMKASRFSLIAPTVIDTTPNKKVGQSLWQFQMISGPKKFSAWNRRSLAFAEQQTLEKNLQSFGSNYQLYQLGPYQYEIVVSKTSGTISQYLSIKFDAVSSF